MTEPHGPPRTHEAPDDDASWDDMADDAWDDALPMSYEEKRSWIFLGTTILSYLVYLAIVGPRLRGTPVTDVAYIGPLLGTIGLAVAASVLLTVIALMLDRDDTADERDVAIHRQGDAVGMMVLSLSSLAVLAMAALEWPHFWIANAVYLANVLSAVISTAVKLRAHRGMSG